MLVLLAHAVDINNCIEIDKILTNISITLNFTKNSSTENFLFFQTNNAHWEQDRPEI